MPTPRHSSIPPRGIPRRAFLLGGSAAAVLVDSDATAATSRSGSATDRSGDDAFPVTIEHRHGSTTIGQALGRSDRADELIAERLAPMLAAVDGDPATTIRAA